MNFIDFARSHGVEINYDKFGASDRIRRCGTTDKPRSDNGAYFWDGQRGWVMNWSGEARVVWYSDPNAKPWTDEEKRQWAAKRQSQQSEQQHRYEQTALKADIILRSAKLEHHPYLTAKGFGDEKGFVLDDKLLIPMRNVATNKLQGLQQIIWDTDERKYVKKMLTGMRAKNAVYRIGEKGAGDTWLVEGYVTGLSVHKALRSIGEKSSVVVCFSASNLITVASQIQGSVKIFADNDASKTGEKSAIETGCPWVMADQEGYDANDLHQMKGIFAVAKKIMDCRAKPMVYS